MKSVLVILTQANAMQLQSHESLSATMVLATFGCEVKVLLKDAALSLLKASLHFDAAHHPFKLGSNMVDSFEFYDLSPILVERQFEQHAFVTGTTHELQFVDLNPELIQQFDHVVYW
ncbi:hypothetical protein [Acinetobacter sp. MD2(2019)]|uniref:hypothetical protein n=1 Tax=Acinetobacter sp. MD2(2019) TaxID=2605273 RepID=UPI002D1F5671|nr:hypothetical protein [Acinetobacter sp. MD2(2019)]MEB3753848.1 hypothetical protein [Acinetobacter sp. MD2(2019)]